MVPGETEDQRQQKAERLAYERGQKDADVAAQLRELKSHAKIVNGSIERMGTSLQGVDDRVDGLTVEIAKMKTKLGFYAALGSLVGGGAVALIVGLATKAGGG